MKKNIIFLFILFFISFFIFNKDKKIEPLNISFYSWENSFNIDKNNITKEKLYIKVLDIAYSTKLELITTDFKVIPEGFIPVIYITNETMKSVDYSLVSSAILKTLNKYKFTEFQIDCDWSDSTRSNYFNLLKDLKQKVNKQISATIRLHQIKYHSRTGTPPVDYGVLMYYNMSNIGDFNTKNSILDNEIAKKYHYNFDTYKLKLKLALPLYSQGIQFRENKALSIFEGLKKEDFDSNFQEVSPNTFKVKKSFYFKGRYVYKDDMFRFEDSYEKEIKIALNDFLNISKDRFNEVIFYTLKYKNKYDLDNLIKEKI